MPPSRPQAGGVGFFDLDDRGTVTVEYTVILVVLALACVLAMIGLGGPLLTMFRTEQAWLLLPFL
jgi:Flp pilus assembly pilin Flp